MNVTKVQIPEGMQDTLMGECVRKRCVERQLRTLFSLSGYQEIETPLLEYYRTFDDAVYGFSEQHVWKTFDRQGRVLALRPDSTIPAVRIAASRLEKEPLPLRLSYVQNVAAFQTDTASALCESTQAGVELMGEADPMADAEVIALSIQAMLGAGLNDFQIDLGQVAFFKGFMEEAGLSPAQAEIFRGFVEEKNTLAMQLFLQNSDVSKEVTNRLMRLPQLYGDASVLGEAESITKNPTCREAVKNLRQVLSILDAYDCRKYVSIDLGMVHAVNYYSGIIFRGITGRLGQPLLSGGRYDGLSARFGREIPATGFGLSVKLLLMALERQGEEFCAPVTQAALGFDSVSLKEAIAWAQEKRGQNISVSMYYGASQEDLQNLIAQGKAVSAAYVENGQVLLYTGEDGLWRA